MAMFSSNFSEIECGKVVMHGKTLHDVRLLLNCIYPPDIHPITGTLYVCTENTVQITMSGGYFECKHELSEFKRKGYRSMIVFILRRVSFYCRYMMHIV